MKKKPVVLFQTGMLSSLLQCHYVGDTNLKELAKKGNFGIGTFNALDGELLLLDGKFYQTKKKGKVTKPSPLTKTPLAATLFFQPKKRFSLGPISSIEQLQEVLSIKLKSTEMLHALRIDGLFEEVRLRSVLKQKPPFRPFQNDPTAASEYTLSQCKGTIVSLFYPKSLGSLNVAHFHFHFIDHEKKIGGHLCNIKVLQAMAQICPIENLHLHLPHSSTPAKTTLKKT
jgi:acetolactate decarboxylase